VNATTATPGAATARTAAAEAIAAARPDTLPPGTTVGRDPLGPQPSVPSTDKGALGFADEPDAAVRLAASRERLKRAMMGPPPGEKERLAREAREARRAAAGTTANGAPLHLSQTLRGWLDKVRSVPAVDVVVDAAETWWAAHPLHTAGAVAADAGKAYVQPIARKNPVAFVLGSAAVGALFFLTRPWRWALRPMLLAGLLPQIVSHALRRAPVASWMHLATAFANRKARPPRRPTPRPARPGTPVA
jgi:hypothetical protein